MYHPAGHYVSFRHERRTRAIAFLAGAILGAVAGYLVRLFA